MAMRSWPGGVKVFSREVPESQRGAGGRLAIWAGRLGAKRRARRKRARGMGMTRTWAGVSFMRRKEKLVLELSIDGAVKGVVVMRAEP
jgi:hypothetical protein